MSVPASAVSERRANRLAQETSPYLLQHAHNPVDWYPWGDEALQRAVTENKPIFLSIGYSACHWCHVMERESFENETIAAFLNEHFVSIKVDREERPDLDAIYMASVQLMTGSGGWPMSVFLTPQRKPFYGGTYFPPENRYGRPGFMSILREIAKAWEERPEELAKQAESLTNAIQQVVAAQIPPGSALTEAPFEKAVDSLRSEHDARDGGFGGAPKFPPSGALFVLLRQHHATKEASLLDMATRTLDKMAAGGMYDQLGGGFHRYSTDAQWLVPHFEKMLYDNALLVQVYLEAFQVTGTPRYRQVALETLDYVLRDLRDEAGGFHSSEDADSQGEEGRFYVWTEAEIFEILGKDAGEKACQFFGVEPDGNFSSHEAYHRGMNILHRPRGAASLVLKEAWRAALLKARSARVRPGRDDKVLTSWNGLMISAFARGYQVTGKEAYLKAAQEAADFLLTKMRVDSDLLRTYRNGIARIPGYLDDYACAIVALVDLYEASFEPRFLDAAQELCEEMITHFWDGDKSVFYATRADQALLIARPIPLHDGAEPSGNSMATLALLRLARLLDRDDFAEKGRDVLEHAQENMLRAPQGFLRMIAATDWLLRPGHEIALVGPRDSDSVQGFLRVAHAGFLPNKMLALSDPALPSTAALEKQIPLLQGKTLVSGQPAAYVCKNYACQLPSRTADELKKALGTDAGIGLK
jgi:uncharacterized protein